MDFGSSRSTEAKDVGVASSFDATPSDNDLAVSFSSAVSAFLEDATISAKLTHSPTPLTASGCGAFLRFFRLSGPVLSSSASSSKAFIVALASTPFSDNDPLHPRILKTLYHHLRPRDFSSIAAVKRFGKHWEEIGFQGVDPSTDLRGVGMLGLLCLLNWFVDEGSRLLALRTYQLSLDADQNFPFCVMSINVTRMCLQQLKAGNLDRDIVEAEKRSKRNEKNTVDDIALSVFMLFYRALFNRLYVDWRDGKKTIADSGFVLKALETKWAQKPSRCMKAFQLGKDASINPGSRGGGGERGKVAKPKKKSPEAVASFTNLGDL